RNVMLIGAKLSSGTEVVETLGAPIGSQADCDTRFGARSPISWMLRALRLVDPSVQVSAVAWADAGGATASTRSFVLANAATVGCNFSMSACNVGIEDDVATVVGATDPLSKTVDDMVAAINGNAHLPFSATAGATPTAGSETSSPGSFPVSLANGDTFLGKVDEQGSASTLTIHATAATKTGSGATYVALTPGSTLVVTVAGIGGQQTISFSGSENTENLYIAKINQQLVGAFVQDNGSGQLEFVTNQMGSGAGGSIVSGTTGVLAALGLTAGAFTNAGPNNVANVGAVQASEMASLLTSTFTGGTAGSTGTANSNGSVTWASNTDGPSPKGVQFTSGSGVAKVAGWDTSEHNGTTGSDTTITLTTYEVGSLSAYWLAQVRFAFSDPTNATTVSPGSVTPGSGTPNVAAAIEAIDQTPGGFTYHAIEATSTSAVSSSDGQLGEYAAYITRSLAPASGKNQMLEYGVDGTSTQATAVSQSSVINSVLMKDIPIHGCDWQPCMNAAQYTGILSKEQSAYCAVNLTNYTTNSVKGTVCSFPAPFNK